MKNFGAIKNYVFIFAAGLLFFTPYLGEVRLFDWDEINFAEAAREMIVTGDYLTVRIDYEPFHEKPPLFFWMQVVSMKIFGVNEFAARFPNALVGAISLTVLFGVGRKLFDDRFGVLWVLAYLGSFLPHFYFKSGLIDPTFNLFMFLGIYYLYRFSGVGYEKPGLKYATLAGVFVGLAVLTKGPVGYLLPALSWGVFYIVNLIKTKKGESGRKFPLLGILLFTIVAYLPSAAWYAAIYFASGANVLDRFVDYHVRLLSTGDAGHSGPFYYHFVVLLIGCFPASIIALLGFGKADEDYSEQRAFRLWMIVFFSVVLIVFSIVQTKILHYSSAAYYPITFFAAYSMFSVLYRECAWKPIYTWAIGILGFIWAALFVGLPLALMNIDSFLPKITDEFTRGLLTAEVEWGGGEILIGIAYFIGLFAAVYMLVSRRYLFGFLTLFFSTAITVFLFLPYVAPKIEAYTQGPAMDFYQRMQGRQVYVEPLEIGNFKYGQYFYTRKSPELSPPNNPNFDRDNYLAYLLTGELDRPAYFFTKNKKEEKFLRKYPDLIKIDEKSGFVFFKREPADSTARE